MVKLSVFTVATPDLTPDQLCREAAAAGIEGIEWRCKETPEAVRAEPPSFWGNNRCTIAPGAGEAEIAIFDEAARRHGCTPVALAPYLTCGDIAGTEQVFRLASRLGTPMVRVGVPGYDRSRNYNELFEQAVDYLTEVEPLARTYGVKALVEVHHYTIAPSASLTHRLISRFDPDLIGALYDPGNMVHEGFENYRLGMELLGPYLAHVHVKNAGWLPAAGHPNADQAAGLGGIEGDPLNPAAFVCGWRPVASGIVPWKQVLADLHAVGYNGWFGLEDFSGTYDTVSMLQTYGKQMRAWMEEL
ncbi:sugar phosphate isomerase/epimerase family protein [Paenibacillus spongiae]|uniref:Sugar phosphate isomerase/epimerase n=1 Tax=Paenibacillus spongiae TaxID=2909671 RepID=A0ABY5SBM3_9BACL|nr:sugar phosphate isomerase/epimerase [Paenibacillus spongiae]UVI31322.1 sugar phosphate isomerase/epimerase [Paenibacillus spongiae]